MHRPGMEALHRHLERELSAIKGVDWAQINSITGRVMVALDPEEGPDLDSLIEVVESAEDLHDVKEERFPHEKPELPGDPEPLVRNLVALGGDLVGMGLATFGMAARITPLPGEIASVVALAQHERRIHQALERRLGHAVTDVGLSLAGSVIHSLTENPLNLIADGIHRASLLGEIRSRQKLWDLREPEMLRRQRGNIINSFEHAARMTPLPKGPIEKYSDRVSLGAIGGFGLGLALTGDPRRSFNLLTAGLPKAARLGREAFAAQLGRELADRGVLVMDSEILRRLDRIDTVVIDAELAATRGGTSDPRIEILVEAAQRAGHLVVVTSSPPSSGGDERVRVMPGGKRLHATVLDLQDEGRAVLLATVNRHHAAMHASDCCVALMGEHGDIPWGADLIATRIEDVWFTLEASALARDTSRVVATIAGVGSGVGSIWAMVGTRGSASNRTTIPVNASTLLAQGVGTVTALNLGRKRAPLPPPEVAWHEMETGEVVSTLSTSSAGLTSAEALGREPARPPTKKETSSARLAKAVVGELANPLTPILAIGVGLSAAVGSMADAVLVGGVVTTNALVGGIEKVRTEVSLEKLVRLSGAKSHVRRDGECVEIEPSRLVRGDVVELEAGDVVPADCRILEADGCEVDESSLTGESLPVVKHALVTPGAAVPDRQCMLFEGSTVVNGSALAVVVATGDTTEAGRALAGAPEPPPSGVEARLRGITAVTAPATIASGAAVTGLSLLRGGAMRQAVSSGVSLMVAAVPEGLPLLANVAQLASARRLSRRAALVRNPRTIEALGRVDVLCFDKTGTLTAGKISLQRVSDGTGDEAVDALSASRRAVLGAALRASPIPDDDDEDPLPHATDQAVVDGGSHAAVTVDEGVGTWQPIGEVAFEPARGYHAAIGTGDAGTLVAVKGAPEVVLPKCSTWTSGDGVKLLGARTRQRLQAEAERLAAKGLRVLAVAQKPVASRKPAPANGNGPGSGADIADEHLTGMELLGFLGLADGVRPTAASAVSDLRRAGVDVVMITGDHPVTAEAIGTELGIVNGKGIVTGPEIDLMSDHELDKAVDTASVFARVTPNHKVRIVGAFQRSGHVVAMTGDGANDAAAVRLAHAGIALGRRGAQATIDAADVVVTDDKIETIIDAIIEGRAMWASVRDALAILVGGNVGEVAFTVAATAMSGSSPLGTRQLLLVNLLTDMLPAMTIALRPPSQRSPETLLHEGPEASLGGALIRQIAIRAAATGGGATAAWMVARSTGTAQRARTVALAALVGTQLAQTAVVGRRSPLVLASAGASAAALAAIVQTPGLSQFFGCTPLGPVGWSIAGGATAAATTASVFLPPFFQYLKNLAARHPEVT